MTREVGSRQPPWVGVLQLLALWSFAVVQPLFDLLADNTTFFLYHRATWYDALLLALFLILPAAGGFWLVEWASALVSRRIARACRVLMIGVLSLLFFVQPLKQSVLIGPNWVLPLALAAALALLIAYTRYELLRRWLTLLSAATPVFTVLFLLAPQVRALAERPRVQPRESSLEAPRTRTNVIVVVFDGLPLATLFDSEYRIDSQLFPNFSRLAEMSHWFRNASTPASMTRLAVPALLTGRFAPKSGAATLTAYPDNLFTLLEGSHRIEALETITRLAPRPDQELLAGGRPRVLGPIVSDLWVVYQRMTTPEPWLDRLPVVQENWGGFVHLDQRPRKIVTARGGEPDDPRGRRFERFVDSIESSEEGQLYYLHTLLPHDPVRFLPSGRRYRAILPKEGKKDFWWVDEDSVSPRKALRHVLQTQYADTLLGQLLDRLQVQNILDESLIVVSSDHGQTLWPGGQRRSLKGVAHPDDILRVPLFIKRPGQRTGEIDDRNVDLRDVTPAIADLVDVNLSWEVEGHSPFDADFPIRGSKALADEQGTVLEFPPDFAPDPDTRALMERYFPSRYEWRRLNRFGPMPDLVGWHLDELDTVEATYSVTLDDESRLLDVDEDASIWPVRISGTLNYPAASDQAVLALAIGGRIEMTTRAKFRQGETLFSTIVDERAIRPGANQVEVLVIDPVSGRIHRRASPVMD